MHGNITIGPAQAADQQAIEALVKSDRLNPNNLPWQNFLVAHVEQEIVGIVQMRKHADGARELGSLLVVPALRGQGLARLLVNALLQRHSGAIHMITALRHGAHYRQFGFEPISPWQAPSSIRKNYLLGSLAFVIALMKRRRPRRLVVLLRQAAEPASAAISLRST
jgi:amino-acid N-acetyltransferase